MLITHLGKSPQIDPSAWVAPDATLCGDVHIGPDCRIGYGARLIAEGAPLSLGRQCIVMENAVLRSQEGHALTLGSDCLVGPQAHIVGCQIGNGVFLATGCAVYHGARLGDGAEVRIHGVVHIKTVLEPGATVPIGWVALGNPAQVHSPHEHEKIWAAQQPLNFPAYVYGVDRNEDEVMRRITKVRADLMRRHADDAIKAG